MSADLLGLSAVEALGVGLLYGVLIGAATTLQAVEWLSRRAARLRRRP